MSAHCPPVESYILINTNGVIVSTRALLASENQVTVTIGFEVPEGSVVILEKQNIVSMVGENKFSSGNLSGRVWVSRSHIGEFQTDSPMVGKKEERFLWPGHLMEKQTMRTTGFPLSYPCLIQKPSL